MKYHLPRVIRTSWSSCRHGRRPGLVSIGFQQQCGRDRNQNASEAGRDLHRKLIGDVEQAMWLASASRTPPFDLECHPSRVSARRGISRCPSRSTRISPSRTDRYHLEERAAGRRRWHHDPCGNVKSGEDKCLHRLFVGRAGRQQPFDPERVLKHHRFLSRSGRRHGHSHALAHETPRSGRTLDLDISSGASGSPH
jgi:hypothetical protein